MGISTIVYVGEGRLAQNEYFPETPLSFSNVRFYQLAAQLHYIADWINDDLESVWLDLETLKAGSPLPSLICPRIY